MKRSLTFQQRWRQEENEQHFLYRRKNLIWACGSSGLGYMMARQSHGTRNKKLRAHTLSCKHEPETVYQEESMTWKPPSSLHSDTFSRGTTTPKPTQIVPPTGYRVFKHLSQSEAFSFKPPCYGNMILVNQIFYFQGRDPFSI